MMDNVKNESVQKRKKGLETTRQILDNHGVECPEHIKRFA
jgi:hypothetical protein